MYFFHKLVTDEDIIINNDTKFSYDEHLNPAKKILKLYNVKIFHKQKNIRFSFYIFYLLY